jgi:hypothetical protein
MARTLEDELKARARHNGTAYRTEKTRPEILITTAEHEVNDQAVLALAADPSLYQRGGLLVRIVRDEHHGAGIRWSPGPRIDMLPRELLRERLCAVAHWKSETRDGGMRDAHPPGWCVSAVHARAAYPGVSHLYAVIDHPVLRPDGTILATAGYDAATGLYLDMGEDFLEVPEVPTRSHAQAAVGALLDVVQDFPFAAESHKSAWLAALLTPLARFAFDGPAPLFLCDANVRAAGKGLLLDCISEITTGRRFTVATYTHDEDELRKRITSLALAGDPLVLLDNLDGRFGNAVLDAALTAVSWKDRILGVNRTTAMPLYITWFATGNNVAVMADTARRICHIRLESDHEQPELRTGFRHPDLLAHVRANRARLLSAALIILRGYYAAGRPDMSLAAWGSYTAWSGLIRAAVVWAGMPDPAETRLELQERADVTAEFMGVILAGLEELDPDRQGMTAAEIVAKAKEATATSPEYLTDLRDAIEGMVGRLDPRALGNRLRGHRRRVFGRRYLDVAARAKRKARWAVYPASAFSDERKNTHHTHHTHPDAGRTGECGESGECVPRPLWPAF